MHCGFRLVFIAAGMGPLRVNCKLICCNNHYYYYHHLSEKERF